MQVGPAIGKNDFLAVRLVEQYKPIKVLQFWVGERRKRGEVVLVALKV
jgi:hypothetical protein